LSQKGKKGMDRQKKKKKENQKNQSQLPCDDLVNVNPRCIVERCDAIVLSYAQKKENYIEKGGERNKKRSQE